MIISKIFCFIGLHKYKTVSIRYTNGLIPTSFRRECCDCNYRECLFRAPKDTEAMFKTRRGF